MQTIGRMAPYYRVYGAMKNANKRNAFIIRDVVVELDRVPQIIPFFSSFTVILSIKSKKIPS